ncbi:caspase domain-containing protein [Schizophyllum commune]
MWNNDNRSPPAGFPSPTGGYNPGYQPGYAPPPGPPPPGPHGGYAPPPGPPGPPGSRGWAPPPGPPPSCSASYAPPPGPPPPPRSTYPGQQYHQQQGYQGGGGYQPAYSSPPPPPAQHNRPAYAPPAGPPPGARNQGMHMPPTGQQHYGPQFENQSSHQMQQPYFQYSQCTGKKKALCIGINYVGQKGELKGCINDARNIQRFLCANYGYKQDDIVMLTDDASNPRQIPTRDNIIAAMQWLVRGAQPNDSLFFHYSGHGGSTKDLDGDEADGYDEVIYPIDYENAGHLVDDLMHDIMVKPLPAGCRLTAIFDSCHSGSALDLPYVYSTEGKVKEPNLAAEAGQGVLSAVTSYAKGDMSGVFKSAVGLFKTASGNTQKAQEVARQTKTSPADVISWSGCKDSQTSADAYEAGQATGAMSYAFMTALSQNKQQTYQQLLVEIRGILKAKYSQKPQLSASHPIDTSIMFIC